MSKASLMVVGLLVAAALGGFIWIWGGFFRNIWWEMVEPDPVDQSIFLAIFYIFPSYIFGRMSGRGDGNNPSAGKTLSDIQSVFLALFYPLAASQLGLMLNHDIAWANGSLAFSVPAALLGRTLGNRPRRPRGE